jgi:S1-C subfamily serine protease
MNNPHVTPMIKRFAFATAVLFVLAIITVTSTFNRVILTPAAVVAQTQQINSPSQGTNSSSSNPLPLKTIFKQVENSVVQITSKIPTTPNPLNPQSPNATALGSGFIYDGQGHIVTNNHVVGDAKIVDVTFVNGNRYTAVVIASDPYSDIAVLQLLSQNASQP